MKEYESEMYSSLPLFLYDEQFSVKEWKNEIEIKKESSNKIVDKIKAALPKEIQDDDFRLVVDVDDDFKESYKSGAIKLVVSKNGDVQAQIKRDDGKFGKKLPIKEELVDNGISSEELQAAFQNEMLQNLLYSIIDTLNDIEKDIKSVLQGQKNDRMGLFYSGMSLYLESKCIQDNELRKQIIAQSIRSISEASAKIMQEMRFDIQYLVNKEYKKEKKKEDSINKRMTQIKENLEVIYKSYFMKAMIYSENNENIAMLAVLEEYGRFINQMIAPYVNTLTECDPDDTLLVGGIWEKRAEAFIEARNVRKALEGEATLYLVKEN